MQDIPGYEGLYAVTRDGQVWSYPKQRSSKFGKWMTLQIHVNNRDRLKPRSHYNVGLFKDKKRKLCQVHRLVGLAYIPNPDNLPQINHIDGNSLNNWDWNLEWATGFGNMQHAQDTGLLNQYTEKQRKARSESGKITGPMNGMKSRRKFSFAEAECIRKIYKFSKKSYKAMARAYNCSDNTIRNICNNKSYLIDIEEPKQCLK